jgi:outer membrane protein TolC
VYAANEALSQSVQDALLAVETAYYAQVSAQAAVTAAQASVIDASKALETAQARFKAGVGTELDILLARTANDQALYSQAAAQGQLRTAQGALAVAAGLPADTRLTTVPPTDEIPPRLDSADVRRIVNESIGRRTDIAALRSTLEAARAAVRVAHAASWPSLYLSGGIARDFAHWYEGAPNAGDRDWSYSAGLRLSWTLFDGWQTESEIRIAVEQERVALAQLERAELAASADVWNRRRSASARPIWQAPRPHSPSQRRRTRPA